MSARHTPETDSDAAPEHAEADQPTNRAARRARARGRADAQTEVAKSTFHGRRNPVVTPRRWAARRSG
jgi:hypothetical protein